MNELILSIIIPVYNTEKYIKECIESVLKQSVLNIEIILVNDGSTDGSKEVCEYYEKKYDIVKLINKENGGLSDARNCGILNSKGDYIIFIDSDDFINSNALKDIYEILKKNKEIDLIFLEAVKFFENTKKTIPLGDGYDKTKIENKTKKEVLKHIAQLPKYPASACTKVIRKRMIIDKNLFFVRGITNEDVEWTIRLLLAANVFWYYEKTYYYYRQERAGSITNIYSLEKFMDLFNIIKKYANMTKENIECEFRNEILSFMAYEFNILLMNYAKINQNYDKKLEKNIKEYSWIMNYKKGKKQKILKFIYKMVGIKITSKILICFYKIKQKL